MARTDPEFAIPGASERAEDLLGGVEGSVESGAVENNAADNGVVENGAVENNAADNGVVEGGALVHDAVSSGAVNGGTSASSTINAAPSERPDK